MALVIETPAHVILRWRMKPVEFVRENFQVEPDEWQRDALNLFAQQDVVRLRVAMQACAGPGKSAVLAWCAWNFLMCYGEKGEHPKGAVVSETTDNLRDNLWSEISRWRDRSPLLQSVFEVTSERMFARDHKDTWFLSARSWPRTANAEEQGRTLSGCHSKFVLFLIDESGRIPLAVLKAADQALAQDDLVFGRILQAGNPLTRQGMLYAASVRLRGIWQVIKITGDPADPKRSPRINKEWAQEQIDLYGRDDPWVKAYILGEFPDADFNALLSPEEVEAACRRSPRVPEFEWAPKILGVDVAFEGDDRTVILRRQGCIVYQPVILRNQKPADIAARVAEEWRDWKADACFIDNSGGFGTAVIQALGQTGHAAVPVEFGGKPINGRFTNKRAEMWFAMRDWIKAGGALPNDPNWPRELCEPVYMSDLANGRTKMEAKVQVKRRLGFSPDLADALACTFCQPVAPPRADPDTPWGRINDAGPQMQQTSYDMFA